jgi:glycosyltransferase involved in cell wall biosynthesis
MKTVESRTRPKRHCMIVHAHYPLGETRVQREAEALLRQNYEVDVICLRARSELKRDQFKGVRIFRLPVRRNPRRGQLGQLMEYLAFFFLAMFQVSWLHARRRYDTIQAHNLPDFLIFSAWLPKLAGARLILDLHDLMTEFYIGRFGRDKSSLPVRLVRLQERLSCRYADHVITVSHHWRQLLIDRGVPAGKISVVMNVADDNIFRPPAVPRRPRPEGPLRLIYHGTVAKRYGLDLVLQAMARLREEVPDLHFTLVGRGDEVDRLIRLAQQMEIESQVTFQRDMVPAEALPDIILAADAGVVAYQDDPFTDGLVPTKLMEYAALGLPAIAARTSAIAAYFEDTMVEFFTPGSVEDLARAMTRLYRDRTYLETLACGAEKFNRRYNWTSIGADYVALVDQLAAS